MDDQITSVGALETINLPIHALRAALTCAAPLEKDEDERPLNGVYVHSIGDEYRIVGCDGKRLFVFSSPQEGARQSGEQPVPEWVKSGAIISAEGLKERLSLLEKLGCSTARIAYQVDAPHIVISDPTESCIFKVQPVDGDHYNYQGVVDGLKSFEAHEVGDMTSTAYNTGYLRDVGTMAKQLGAKAVQVFGSSATDPTLVTFPDCPFAILVLMPMQVAKQIGAGAARVLSGAVAGTVAALRAHQTRWANKIESSTGNAKKAAENKVAAYEGRIAAIVAAANPRPALPAPEEVEAEGEVSYAMADAVEQATATPAEQTKADYRRGLKAAAGNKARARFYADVNAALDGVSLSQLADGVPIDDWYDAGLEPEEAAKRCLDWRRIGDVLPPDEVQPGEENLPVGLLQSDARPQVAVEPETAIEPASITISPESAAEVVEAAAGGTADGTLDAEFEAFKVQVSAIIQERQGVALDDLVDVPIRDWFDHNVSAKSAASKAIRAQKES